MAQSFVFDSQGVLLESIHDIPEFVVPFEIDRFTSAPFSKPFKTVSEKLFSFSKPDVMFSQGELFFAGCAVTYLAFEASDLSEAEKIRVKEKMAKGDRTDSKIRHASANVFEMVESLSVQGIHSHGEELGQLDLALQDYYMGTGRVSSSHDLHFVSLAMGFSARRFDGWVANEE